MNVPNVHTHTHSVVAGGLDTSVLWVLTVCVSQGPQEKGLRPPAESAEAVGVVSGPGAGDITALEGGDWTTGQNGPRGAARYVVTCVCVSRVEHGAERVCVYNVCVCVSRLEHGAEQKEPAVPQ